MKRVPDSPPFGIPATEFEPPRLHDTYLSDLGDRRHDRALSPYHRVILGRRGSGKTALAEYLRLQTDRPYDAYAKFDWSASRRIITDVEEMLSRQRAVLTEDVVQLWIIALWTVTMGKLQELGHIDSAAVRKYLSIAQPAAKTTAPQSVLDGLAARVRQHDGTLLNWDRLNVVLEEASYATAVADTKAYLQTSQPVAIVIDFVDEPPVKSAPIFIATKGLLMAANASGQQMHEKIHVKCFVPSEIWLYMAARMEAVGKFLPFEMRWSKDDLLRLVCIRYNNLLSEYDFEQSVRPRPTTESPVEHVRQTIWHRFFPARAEGPSGLLEDVETLIMRHTQLRPRQLIQICNAIADQSEARRFNPDHVRDGLRASVDGLATEVFASYSKIYPDVEDVLQRYLRNRPAIFDAQAINAPDEFWDIAYELGVVGPVSGESKASGKGEAEFQQYRTANFDFGGGDAARWRPNRDPVAVHPMFHKRFGIREDADTMVGLKGVS